MNPTDKIEAVKKLIEQQKSFPAAHQKLIYNGAILDDAKSLEEQNVKESGFCVLMVKAPAAAAPTPAAVAPPVASPAKPAVAASPAPAAAQAPKPAAPAAAAAPESVANAEATLLTNAQQIESTVAQLCEMGFPRDQVVAALRAAFNNPNRAVEYLMSGNIPHVAEAAPAARPAPPAAGGGNAGVAAGAPVNLFDAAAQQRAQPGGGAGAGAGAGGVGPFDFLRQNPQFNQLRFMVQQNPQLLQPILAQLGQANPDLLQMITHHQAEFTALLNEPVNEADLPRDGAHRGPGTVTVALTAAEKEAVDRLTGMGFPQQAALEAFLTCDKNEQLAANFLLEGGGEDFGAFGDDADGGQYMDEGEDEYE